MNRQLFLTFVLVAVIFSFPHNVFGQSIMVGPDGKFEKSVLNLPFAFYNENFGFAGAYVYAVTGYPQKQAALISTAMAGTNGSAMAFLMGRDLQMPLFDRLFLDAIVQAGYFQDVDIYVNGNPAPEATTPTKTITLPAKAAGTISFGSDSNIFSPWVTAVTPLSIRRLSTRECSFRGPPAGSPGIPLRAG